MSQIIKSSSGGGSSGGLVQTVFANNVAGITSTSNTYVNVTGGSLSITPTSAMNYVQLTFTWAWGLSSESSNATGNFTILRNGVDIVTSAGVNIKVGAETAAGGTLDNGQLTYTIIDSPATTSSVTYQIQMHTQNSISLFCKNINMTLQEIT